MASARGREPSELVDGRYGIEELVDLVQLRQLFERFTAATGFTIGFLSHPALEILVATGWRRICTHYHRVCPMAMANCQRSNRHLLDQLDEPGKLVIEPCDNGLVDCATPIIIQGRHVASLATGQVLLEPPDRDRFRRQAREFGLDEAAYLEALAEIPVVEAGRLRAVTAFLGEMARVISQVGYANRLSEIELVRRLRTEERLRESEERYRAVFEGAAEGILVADVETRELLYGNTAAADLFGYGLEELAGVPVTALHPPEALPRALEEFDAQARGERTQASDLPCLRKDGSGFFADVVTRAVQIGGRPRNVGFFSDVTARRQAAADRRKLEAQLVLAQKMEAIGRLAGGVAHDFNNLLSVIRCSADCALGAVTEASPLHGDLREIVEAANRATALTQQLLAFSRGRVLAPTDVDLTRIVEDMAGMLRRIIGEDIDLVLRLPGLLGTVKADGHQLEQVILNLAVNARDAMPQGGRLIIETAGVALDEAYAERHLGVCPGPHVLLAVTDTGAGMDAETQAQIFQPFFTTKPSGRGTGLGLATVYGIVMQCGGHIRVYSEVGRGTTFKIYLPASPTDGVIPPAAPEETVGHGTASTILLVEDDDAVRSVATRILTRAGYTVLGAASGVEALRLAAEQRSEVDLLLTDVVMPGMNGRELAERLRELRPELRVVYMSGHTHYAIVHHGVLDDQTHFLDKPLGAAALLRKVREVLDRPLAVPGGQG